MPQPTTSLLLYSQEMTTPSFLTLVHKVSSHYRSSQSVNHFLSYYPSMLNDNRFVKKCRLIVPRTLLLAGFKVSRADHRHHGMMIMAILLVLCIRNATGLMSLLTTQATSWGTQIPNQYVSSFIIYSVINSDYRNSEGFCLYQGVRLWKQPDWAGHQHFLGICDCHRWRGLFPGK